MTSKNVIFDPRKLEKLLIKDWIEFINPRELLTFIKDNVKQKLNLDPKIQTLLISNCEFDDENRLYLWISYKIIKPNEIVNSTSKVLLNYDGTISEVETIEI